MEKFYNNINELINNEGIKITSLERKIGASFLDLLFGSSKKKRKKRK